MPQKDMLEILQKNEFQIALIMYLQEKQLYQMFLLNPIWHSKCLKHAIISPPS